MKAVIEVNGDTMSDVEIAIEEALRKIKEGYFSGMDSNDTGDYTFTVSEE